MAYGEGYQLSFLSIVDIDIVSKLEELNRVRNLFSHISALSEDQARQMVSINLDNVLSLLKQLENLYEVVIMRYIGQTQPYKIKVERFKGYAINRDIREIEIKQEQMFTHGQYLNDRSILIILSDNIFSVSPFLHFTREGHNTKLCFYTKREGTGPNRRFMYEIFDESRRVEIDEANFSHELSRLDLVLPDTGNSVRGQGTRGRQI